MIKLNKKKLKVLSENKQTLPNNATRKIAGGISGDHVCCFSEGCQDQIAVVPAGN
ncbi:hypothetical protein [Pseudoalteromonas maricaloris]|uniref:hypothetical protein n=1 Tax=Pseudoalteromonas maricaloris TaxID=184924 RepID=UPI000ADF7AA1|nr:hypothetical protein [Pseudoalteromonas flavipulchra]MBE0373371.1 hypothetical protein [Pseudoalteromonas flavipulchra NCIMB 2033 = ATCC BAA-314]